MSNFVEQALERQPAGAPPWLEPLHERGRKLGRGQVLPNIKVEEWKYTSLRSLEEGGFVAAPARAETDPGLAGHFTIEGFECHRLVFVNGQFDAALSTADELPAGVTLAPFSRVADGEAAALRQRLGSLAPPDERLFTAINDSWVADGAYLRVEKNVRVEKPIQLVWVSTPQTKPAGIAQRLFVELEEGSEASVLEHFASSDNGENAFTNGVTELAVGDNARLHHCRLHLEQAGALHIGTVEANLGRAAVLNSFHMALGAVLKRIDLNVRLRGEGAHCELNGVYLPRNKEVVDYHTCLEHEVPHCTSEETFRGIVSDRARAVFNGRIHIHPGAQKTSAHLHNRNLLTSDTAEVDTKPELEIYADDVQCSHGATVAQLDDRQMYYLRTRGVSEQEARVLLSFGFINEILNRIDREPLREYLRPQLAGLFATDPALTRHLL